MRTAIKVILITLGSLIFVGGATAGVGYWWWQKNGEKMIADIKATEVDAAKFAVGKESSACVDEAATRARKAGFVESLSVHVFLARCLRTAKTSNEFCQSVPSPLDVLTSLSWQKQINQKYGLTPPIQTTILPQEIQNFCQGRARQAQRR